MRRLAAAIVLAALTAPAFACPNCKAAVADNAKDSGSGFNFTIYMMLAIVFSLAGSIVWKIVQVARRTDAAMDATLDAADGTPVA